MRRVRLGALGIGILCIAQFADVLSINVAIIALPEIARDLHVDAGTAQWVVSIYALLFGGLLLLAGRLADRVGHRRLLVVGMAVFSASSAACSLAPSAELLIAARAATGAGAALTVPAALALLVAGTRGAGERSALGWWTAAGAGGGIAGLVLGGVVADAFGWRATFAIPAAITLACLPLAALRLPETSPQAPRRLDGLGALTGVSGLLLLLYGLTLVAEEGPRAEHFVPVAAAALLLAAFAAVEARAAAPLLPRSTLANRGLVAGTLASAVNTAATSPLAVLGATYLQGVRDWSPVENGLSFVPFSAAVVAGSALGPRLMARLGARTALAAALVPLAAGPLLCTTVTAGGGEVRLIAALAISGLGLGCAAVVATGVGTGAAAEDERGFAAGLVNTATQLGTAVSVALLVAAASAVGGVDGLRAGFAIAAGVAIVGGALAVRLLGAASIRSLP